MKAMMIGASFGGLGLGFGFWFPCWERSNPALETAKQTTTRTQMKTTVNDIL